MNLRATASPAGDIAPPRSALAVLGAIFACAFGLRLVLLWLHPDAPIDMDGAEYARMAENLRQGHGLIGMRGYPMVLFPPLYSVLIAAASFVTPSFQGAGLLVSVVAGAALVFPVYAIAIHLYGTRAALFAAALVATLPFLGELSVAVISEPLFALVAMTAVALALRSLRTGSVGAAALAGLCFALSYLTRPEGILFAGVVCGMLLLSFRSRNRAGPVLQAIAFVSVFAVCITPYVLWETNATGRMSLEGKTALNYAIGERLAAGMSYHQAANEVGPDLKEVGPEIAQRYFLDADVAGPTLSERLRFAVGATRAHLWTMLRLLTGRSCGSVFLPLLAVLGLVSGPWWPQRARAEALLALLVLANVVALCTVWQFWPRYGAFFVPFFAIWAGHGIDVVRSRVRPGHRLNGAAIAGALLAIVFASSIVSEASRPVSHAEREAGVWLGAHDGGHKVVMETTDLVSFYSGGIWRPLPYADSQTALRYITKMQPKYVVVSASERESRPYLGAWLKHGIPEARAKPVLDLHPGAEDELIVYRWTTP